MLELKLHALKKISPDSFITGIDDIYQSFFGFDMYSHPRVLDNSGAPISEHVFDCLLRHTRGSPREIEDIARNIGALPRTERTLEKVREIINTKSCEFFDYARGQALPYWPDSIDSFLVKLPVTSYRSAL